MRDWPALNSAVLALFAIVPGARFSAGERSVHVPALKGSLDCTWYLVVQVFALEIYTTLEKGAKACELRIAVSKLGNGQQSALRGRSDGSFSFCFCETFFFLLFLPYYPRRLGKTSNNKILAREPYFCGINTARRETLTPNSLNRMSTFRARFGVFRSIFIQKHLFLLDVFPVTTRVIFKYFEVLKYKVRSTLSQGVCERSNDMLHVSYCSESLVRSCSNSNDID